MQQHYDKHLVGTYAYIGAHLTLSVCTFSAPSHFLSQLFKVCGLTPSSFHSKGRRGVGLTISPAWHQTRDKCELLLTGIIPQTRLEVWNSTRWLCPLDPAFQEILGSTDIDAAVNQWEAVREKARARLHRRSGSRIQSGDMTSGASSRERPQSEVTVLEKDHDVQTPIPSRHPSVRFTRSLRKAESRRNLRGEALAWELNNNNS